MKLLVVYLLVVLNSLTAIIVSAHAGEIVAETVLVETPPIMPSAFQLKKAKAKGITLSPTPGLKLNTSVFRPKDNECHPAVVILVGNDGFQPNYLAWGQELAKWGYVAVVVDSYGSRGFKNHLDARGLDLEWDAYATYNHLQNSDYVKSDKIGLFGFALGGHKIYPALAIKNEVRPKALKFGVGISFYAGCDSGNSFRAPILIVTGSDDKYDTHTGCQQLADEAEEFGNDIRLKIYHGATHYFDNPNYSRDPEIRGPNSEKPIRYENSYYDPAAHKDVLKLIHEFLDEKLK